MSLPSQMGASSQDDMLLIVEDEPLIAMALADALEGSGYQVSLCGTGFDALNYIEMEDNIAAVVTDIRLGEGPDGWEVARRARAQFPSAPVLYITGDAAHEFRSQCVPGSVVLQKPFTTNDFIRTVCDLLN